MRGRAMLAAGLLLGGGALAVLMLTEAGADLRARAAPALADLRARLAGAPAASGPARNPPARIVAEGGRTLVRLSDAEQARIGIETVRIARAHHQIEVQAHGAILDLARVTELTNGYASAKAQLQTAEAKAEVSRSAYARARNLGPYATQVQLETTEGTFRTDEAALAAAQSQLRTLAATAQQEWGPVVGRAIVERAPLVTRLIERSEFLVQVTLPPGGGLRTPPSTAHVEVPPQSARVPLRYVSPATRTDQRIQGVSYFYTVAGDSGLLPGMSVLAFLASDRAATGIAVPEGAVVHWQGSAWIYRRVADDTFARHRLRLDGPMSADAYVVDDLGPEAHLVVTGPQTLLSEEMRGQGAAAEADDD